MMTLYTYTHGKIMENMSACVSQRLPIAAEMPPSSLGLFFPQNLGGLAGGCCYSYDPRVVDP
jgi:hypothetical protein